MMPAEAVVLLLWGGMTITDGAFIFSEGNIMHLGGGVLKTVFFLLETGIYSNPDNIQAVCNSAVIPVPSQRHHASSTEIPVRYTTSQRQENRRRRAQTPRRTSLSVNAQRINALH